MNNNRGIASLVVAGVVIACAVVYGGLRIAGASTDADSPAAATAEYGAELMRNTARYIGPSQDDQAMRYSGNHLSCASCHTGNGTAPGTLTLLQAAGKYPDMSGREGRERDLKDRINGCMQRSMNGRPLPRDSIELLSMEQYLYHLSDQYAAMSDEKRTPDEPPAFQEPDRAADVAAGRIVYEERCQVCHGPDGSGLNATGNLNDGYLFPPLWGPDSFNNGAGMTRVLTAARFIKARMPFGQANLSDDQAYDVAAYVNSHWRPEKANLDADYPDRRKKPVDSPYPPYADEFPAEQHRIGPFAPIREYYKKQAEGAD